MLPSLLKACGVGFDCVSSVKNHICPCVWNEEHASQLPRKLRASSGAAGGPSPRELAPSDPFSGAIISCGRCSILHRALLAGLRRAAHRTEVDRGL